MATHFVNSGEDENPVSDSVDLHDAMSDDSTKSPSSTETLEDVDNSYTVCNNFKDMADPSDSSIWVDTKSLEEGEENLICPSPINSYSGYSARPWSSRWYEPWSSFDDVKPLASGYPVWFNEKPSLVGAGLSNLGNTCFLNAVVQCFTHTVPLVEGIRAYDHVMPCDRNNYGFCLLCVFRGHIEVSLASTENVISPWKLVDNLSHFSSSFQRYQQEDAHEFLQCFLDRLESSCSDFRSMEMISCGSNDNLVKQTFGGCLVSKLKCCNCGHFSDTYEPSIDLSLEIEDVTTLEAALESFTKLERIEDPDTKFTCENCKEQVSIEKQLILEETPSVAAFHLKRFKNDGSFVEKIEKFVEFPLELDLRPYTNISQNSDVELKYELFAIVVHIGFSATSGHYYSFIRSAPDTWYKFDDSQVVRVHEGFVMSQDAYILFYAKKGTPWFSTYLENIKPFLDPHSSNTSPTSVLDNVDIPTSSPNNVTEPSHTAHENIFESSSGSRHDPVDNLESKDNTERMSTSPLGATFPVDDAVDGSQDNDAPPRVSTAFPPGTSIPMKCNCYGIQVFSPSVLQEYSLNQDDAKINADNAQTPLKSSSPDIYRDESSDAESNIKVNNHKLVNQGFVKNQSKVEAETKLAQRSLRSLPAQRSEALSAAMPSFRSEDSQRSKRRRRMNLSPDKDDSASTTQRKAGLRSLRPLAAGSFR